MLLLDNVSCSCVFMQTMSDEPAADCPNSPAAAPMWFLGSAGDLLEQLTALCRLIGEGNPPQSSGMHLAYHVLMTRQCFSRN
jgi:hypothetical protein